MNKTIADLCREKLSKLSNDEIRKIVGASGICNILDIKADDIIKLVPTDTPIICGDLEKFLDLPVEELSKINNQKEVADIKEDVVCDSEKVNTNAEKSQNISDPEKHKTSLDSVEITDKEKSQVSDFMKIKESLPKKDLHEEAKDVRAKIVESIKLKENTGNEENTQVKSNTYERNI